MATSTESQPIPLFEWRAEGHRRFGERGRDWRFVCPRCGHVASCADVHAAGGGKEAAATNCIGRFDRSKADCDWAAYGLLGNLGKGPVVATLDGKTIQVFAFAEETA